jgi:hypothetical protein
MLRTFIVAACLLLAACSSTTPTPCGFCGELAGTGDQE